MSKETPKNCPCCHREFTQMEDYPQISIERWEWSPVGITAEDALVGTRFGPSKDSLQIWQELCRIPEFEDYILRLKQLRASGTFRTIEPKELLPTKTTELFAENGYFKWAYEIPLPTEQYYLAWQEKELGISQLMIFCNGPNMGSAGGPTLVSVGVVATIYYRGVVSQ